MKIEAYLANIEKNGTKIIDILEEKYYKKGTDLNIENLRIPTYYSIKKNRHNEVKYYNLIFKVVCEDIQNIKLAYIKEGTTGKELEKVKYKNKEYFVERIDEEEENKKDYATIGYETLEVIDKRSNEVIKSIDIEIFSNAIDYNQYIEIINDLIRIKKDIIYQGDKKGYIGENLIDKGEEEYLKEAKNIYSLAKRIFNKPRTALGKENIYKNVNNIKKITPKLLIEKEINPYKNKYLIQKGKDDINIYENRMIKYALEKILLNLNNYRYIEKNKLNEAKIEIKGYKEKISDKCYIDAYESIKKCLGNGQKEEYNNLQNISEAKKYILYIKTNNKEITEDDNEIDEKNKYFKLDFNEKSKMFKISIGEERKNINGNKNLYLFSNEKGDTSVISPRLRGGKCNESKSYYIVENKKVNAPTKYFNFSYENKNLENIKNVYDVLTDNNNNNSIIEFNVDAIHNEEENNNDFGFNNDPFIIKRINSIKVIKISNLKEEKICQKMSSKLDDYMSFLDKFDEKILPIKLINYVEKKENDYENIKIKLKNMQLEKFSDNIKNLIHKKEIMNVKSRNEILRNTQIFNSDPNYNKIFRAIKKLDKKTEFLSEVSANKYFLKTGPNIYELWCYYKMIYILIYEMGWKIKGEKNLSKEISDILEGKHKKENKKTISLYHKVYKNEDIYLDISYEPEIKKKEEFISKLSFESKDYNDNTLTPDYKLEFLNSDNKTLGTFYLDAKFKDFKKMGKKSLDSEIEKVSICKYYNIVEDEYVKGSFIIHTMQGEEYTKFGGINLSHFTKDPYNKDLKRYEGKAKILTLDDYNHNKEKYINYEPVNHKFGAFCLTPYNTKYFKIFIKMILEYHLGYYNVCWNCEKGDVQTNKLLTMANNPKYHFRCKNCGEFWIKSHCSNSGHNIIKHINNYHTPKDNSPWYLTCPKCFDGKFDNL